MKHKADIQEKATNLAQDAQELLAATADVSESKVIEARKRLSAALERGKQAWGQFQEQAAARPKWPMNWFTNILISLSELRWASERCWVSSWRAAVESCHGNTVQSQLRPDRRDQTGSRASAGHVP